METYPKHSVQAYLTRLSTEKLELILQNSHDPAFARLSEKDFAIIQQTLKHRKETARSQDSQGAVPYIGCYGK